MSLRLRSTCQTSPGMPRAARPSALWAFCRRQNRAPAPAGPCHACARVQRGRFWHILVLTGDARPRFITLCSRSRCGAREAMTVGCKPTRRDTKRKGLCIWSEQPFARAAIRGACSMLSLVKLSSQQNCISVALCGVRCERGVLSEFRAAHLPGLTSCQANKTVFRSHSLGKTCRAARLLSTMTDDIRLPFSLGEKRKLRAARGSGITATTRYVSLRSEQQSLRYPGKAKRPEGRAARGRPGNVWQLRGPSQVVRRSHPSAILNRFASNGGSGNVRQPRRTRTLHMNKASCPIFEPRASYWFACYRVHVHSSAQSRSRSVRKHLVHG